MSAPAETLPPHDPYHERMALACILTSPRACLDDADRLGAAPDWFYVLTNREIFERAVDLRAHPSVDSSSYFLVQLAKTVKHSTFAELVAIENDCPTPALFDHFASVVREFWLRRFAARTHGQLALDAMDSGTPIEDLFSAAEKAALAMSDTYMASKSGGTSRVLSPEAGMRETFDDVQRRFDLNARNELPGVPSGFPAFDNMTGGFQAGELAIVAARPSQGKTALACSVAHHVAYRRKETVVFVTLEMSPAALGRRLMSIDRAVPASNIRRGNLTEGDLPKIQTALAEQNLAKIYWVNGVAGMTCEQIEREVRALLRSHQVRLVIIDYLQKIRPSKREEKRTYEVGAVSGALKGLAASMKVAVLALAQLNRDPDKDKGRPPRVSDLADSAQIERDADMIAMIHRKIPAPGASETEVELIVGKQRDGETGIVKLVFLPKYARFESSAGVHEQDVPESHHYNPTQPDP